MALARLGATALDCDDPVALGQFWAQLIDGEVIFSTESFVAVKSDRGMLTMQKVDDYAPPQWPGDGRPKQMHLDLAVSELDPAVADAVRLGATIASDQPSPDRWRVLIDPAGHPFCLTTLIPEF